MTFCQKPSKRLKKVLCVETMQKVFVAECVPTDAAGDEPLQTGLHPRIIAIEART